MASAREGKATDTMTSLKRSQCFNQMSLCTANLSQRIPGNLPFCTYSGQMIQVIWGSNKSKRQRIRTLKCIPFRMHPWPHLPAVCRHWSSLAGVRAATPLQYSIYCRGLEKSSKALKVLGVFTPHSCRFAAQLTWFAAEKIILSSVRDKLGPRTVKQRGESQWCL